MFWRAELHEEPCEGNSKQSLQDSGKLDYNQQRKMSPTSPPMNKGSDSMYRGNGPELSSSHPNQFSDQGYQGNMPGPATNGSSRFANLQNIMFHEAQDNVFSEASAQHHAPRNTTRTQSRATPFEYESVQRSYVSVTYCNKYTKSFMHYLL